MAFLWSREVSIDYNLIPTIVNGATSTTSLLAAFTGILFSIGHSQQLKLEKIRNRSYFTLLVLSVGLLQIAISYVSFVNPVNYTAAFRHSISGLILCIGAFGTFSNAWFKLNF